MGEAILANPKLEVTLDLVNQKVTYGGKLIPVTMLEGPRTALVTGEFDFLGQLLAGEPQIREKAAVLPYMTNFA